MDLADNSSQTQGAARVIVLAEPFFFFLENLNRFPLLEWQTTIQPGYAMPKGGAGQLRIDRTEFYVQDELSPLYLVWRDVPRELFEESSDDSVLEFQLNGMDLDPLSEPAGFPESDIVFDLGPCLALGENRLIVTSASSTRQPIVVQDALDLWGEFAVRELDTRVLTAPPLRIEPGSWTGQGYPVYRGVGVYRQRVTLPADVKNRPIFLVCESVSDEVEICVNGTIVDILRREPWRIEITEALKDGENWFQFRIGNSQQTEWTQPIKPSGLLGPVYLEVF